MLGPHKLIIDEWAEVVDLLDPYADGEFWTWEDVEFDPTNTYIVGRVVLKENWQVITDLATQHPGRIVFCNPAEGSETILLQLKRLRIEPHVRDGRILLLTSGDLEPGWNQLSTDCYFTNIVDYTENKAAQLQAAGDYKHQRPYDFLFLNGRLRPHRKWLIDGLRERGLLDHALWTNLGSHVEMDFTSMIVHKMLEPIRLLPPEYEIERAQPNIKPSLNSGFVKHDLFNNTWGDAIINPCCYTDTWFSVVTETIFDYPHSFRTEKIWKPIIMAHPFVVAANRGYYRDSQNAGFQTFAHYVDESFDQIDCPYRRAERIIDTVHWIVRNGAAEFWDATRDVCKYNQQHLVEYNQIQRTQLPQQLEQFLNERSGIPSASIR